MFKCHVANVLEAMTKLTAEMHGRGLLITGDSKIFKDVLKSQGGNWNGRLKGWIFPGSKKPSVFGALQSAGIDFHDGTTRQPEPEPAAKKQKSGSPGEKKQNKGTCAAATAGSDEVCSWQLGGPECGSAAVAAVAPGDSDGDPRKFVSVRRGHRGVKICDWYGNASVPKTRSLGGLALTAEEWNRLKQAVPEIDAELKRLENS